MNIYFAPMEGITGYVQRHALYTHFPGIHKYFPGFIVPNQLAKLSSKEINDILPEHNEGRYLVPQLMTNHADNFIKMEERLAEYGYKELNLNLGCPSKTVVSKGRGSGFLAKPEELDRFLEAIYSNTKMKISIKTRIGKEDPEEMVKLLDIYNQYPVHELIVHPRLQTDFYNNTPNLDIFAYVCEHSKAPVCYNGDIVTAADYNRFIERFPDVDNIMIGRGILRNPGLVDLLMKGTMPEKQQIRAYHDQIYKAYQEILFGEKNVLFKMKELWCYMIHLFETSKKHEKSIKKAERLDVYERAVDEVFLQSLYDL